MVDVNGNVTTFNSGYSGNPSPVSDFVLGTLAQGFYTITLYIQSIEGCEITSDPIQLTINGCPCDFIPDPDIEIFCMYPDIVNGGFHYYFILQNPTPLPNTVSLNITSPQGGVNIFQNTGSIPNLVYGTFWMAPGTGSMFCFQLDYSNPKVNTIVVL